MLGFINCSMLNVTAKARYRLGQVWQQLGFIGPLAPAELAEVRAYLPDAAFALFRTMSHADQQHSLRVYHGLQASGCQESDMLMAALLHDVGKAQGRVPFWTRPAIVIGKLCAPRLLKRLTVTPAMLAQGTLPLPAWQRALSYAWWHADVGADLAEQAGLSERAVLYIRTHHQPHGPAAQLHRVDEVS